MLIIPFYYNAVEKNAQKHLSKNSKSSTEVIFYFCKRYASEERWQ
jgi:hypothetical protein